jgi:hypothetical protein
MGEGPKIADAFSLVMDAYLTFDAGGKGYITKEDMHSFIVRLGARSPSKSTSKSGRSDGAATAFLTEERMNEMDWDKTGRISYSEFVYSFLGWVGFEDEDEDDKVRLVQRHTTPYAPSPREPSTWYFSRVCSSYNTS